MIRISLILTLVLSASILSSCNTWANKWGAYRHLERAEDELSHKKYDEACESYRQHVETRLKAKDRPDWENPYFYYLIIGDIRLRQNKVKESLAAYEFAETKKVEPQLISDRFRHVAKWHEQSGDIEASMNILKKYRDRDPLLFDAILDRLAKELTAIENQPFAPSEIPH